MEQSLYTVNTYYSHWLRADWAGLADKKESTKKKEGVSKRHREKMDLPC